MPTITFISTVTHMTIILIILIFTASAILKNIVYNMNNINVNQYYVHNPLLIDSNFLIFQIENSYMTLLSQLFNDWFAK